MLLEAVSVNLFLRIPVVIKYENVYAVVVEAIINWLFIIKENLLPLIPNMNMNINIINMYL